MAALKKAFKDCFLCSSSESTGKDNEKQGLFSVPYGKVLQWQSVIVRPGLKANSRLCGRHFDENDIIKGKTILNVFLSVQQMEIEA